MRSDPRVIHVTMRTADGTPVSVLSRFLGPDDPVAICKTYDFYGRRASIEEGVDYWHIGPAYEYHPSILQTLTMTRACVRHTHIGRHLLHDQLRIALGWHTEKTTSAYSATMEMTRQRFCDLEWASGVIVDPM